MCKSCFRYILVIHDLILKPTTVSYLYTCCIYSYSIINNTGKCIPHWSTYIFKVHYLRTLLSFIVIYCRYNCVVKLIALQTSLFNQKLLFLVFGLIMISLIFLLYLFTVLSLCLLYFKLFDLCIIFSSLSSDNENDCGVINVTFSHTLWNKRLLYVVTLA
jgi:hypothetical protein